MDLASDGSESETSVLEPVSEWETQFCSTAGCTKGAIKQGKKALLADCAKEIKAGEMIPSIAMTMLDNYSLVRSLACTAAAQNKKGDYCFRGVLADLEVSWLNLGVGSSTSLNPLVATDCELPDQRGSIIAKVPV